MSPLGFEKGVLKSLNLGQFTFHAAFSATEPRRGEPVVSEQQASLPCLLFFASSALLVHSSFLDPLLAVVSVQQLGKCLSGVRGKPSNIVCPVKDCML